MLYIILNLKLDVTLDIIYTDAIFDIIYYSFSSRQKWKKI